MTPAVPTVRRRATPAVAIAAHAHGLALRLPDRLRRLRDEGGQGTVEYVALAMLVAALMAGVVTAAGKTMGSDIATAIAKKIKGAIDGAGKQ
ncbi:hypothetical protein SK069_04815 [Patulibacter brassicae]|jgi:Flp pilus assembly pilin Flp|uniref:DUF4244 domain-containing protein n=1 Tax=Patulibacter brassicae TaxID=1705717 RepID=A0ABU4VGG4_9ACTN|nr:hypothetical protein [Patulibacter brassicae]MDX8150906.1 hypothetical protein [Patulibacter brassicae]